MRSCLVLGFGWIVKATTEFIKVVAAAGARIYGARIYKGVFGKRQRRSTEKLKHAIWPHGPAVWSSGNFNVNEGEDICLGRF